MTRDGNSYTLPGGTPTDAPTFSFTPTDDGSDVVSLTVIDDDHTATDNEELTVANAPSAASVTGSSAGVRGQTLTFTLGATDPSSEDQAAGFSYSIDWNGDGTTDEVIPTTPGNGAGLQVNHVFTEEGAYTVKVTATDKDGARFWLCLVEGTS